MEWKTPPMLHVVLLGTLSLISYRKHLVLNSNTRKLHATSVVNAGEYSPFIHTKPGYFKPD